MLLTTFSDTLANALRTKLRRLISNEPRLGERLEVHSLNAIGERLYATAFRSAEDRIARSYPTVHDRGRSSRQLIRSSACIFLLTEWEELVDAWQLESWEAYRDVARLGQKDAPAGVAARKLWSVLERCVSRLHDEGLITRAECSLAWRADVQNRKNPPFDFVVVEKRRMSALRSCGSWPRSEGTDRTPLFRW